MKQALEMALEALKYPLNQSHENFNVDMAELLAHRAITAIKEALAQPEQEPVAWMHPTSRDCVSTQAHSYKDAIPLYKSPPQRKPLTDKEIGAILEGVNAYGTRLYTFARAIEAAHGIGE